jgi:hypothetical protein
VTTTTDDLATQATLWTQRLWGDGRGHACLGLGHEGHFTPSDRYEFTRFEQRFYVWPDDAELLIADALGNRDALDVYVGVLLRRRPSRKHGTALDGRVAWADVDGPWTPARQAGLDRLASRTVWQVDSGGGRHVYLPLDAPQPAPDLEAWNRRLGILLDADAGWSETKVLRLPGTLNHKRRARGDKPTPVQWVHERP